MGLQSLLLLFVIAVLPFIQGTTPAYYRSIGQQPGSGIYPDDDYMDERGQDYGLSYGSSSGRIWCTCRRRCRYREWTAKYTCLLPFYPRYWNTCCKYLRNYQTSSMYRGYPGSMYPGRSPYQPDPQMTYPTYPTYPSYPVSRGGSLPPKGA
ncbi:unnamed protein product [Mytilus coruscus]|uniref:Uncharacterized protein n=1 Tax=Mytilus coruscus TaxID=42192 RepID=A0A6J8DT70_MYTCO|nr:unnamed protein product [Mytilus coruscus]